MKKLYQKINKIYDALKVDNIQISPELNQQLQTLNNNYTSLVKTYEDNEGFKKKLNDCIKSGGQGEKIEQPTESDKKAKQMRADALNQYKNKNGSQQNQSSEQDKNNSQQNQNQTQQSNENK